MKTKILFSSLGLVLSSLLTLIAAEFSNDWTWDEDPAHRKAHAALEGKPMPPFQVKDWINGGIMASDIKGKVILVDLYATWCGPCMEAIPHNNQLQKKYKSQGLVIVGICTSDTGQEIFASNARQHGIQYPAARDPELKMQKAWAAEYYPTYALVDRKGIVRIVGANPDRLEEIIKKLLAEKAR